MSSHVRILGIAGSLRRGSYNQAALRAAKLLVPENSEIDLFQLDDIPMFNEDEEKRPPSSILELKNRIRRADALLIVTPEYNYSIPGVLKNAIDWACRPYGESDYGCVTRRNRNRSSPTPSAANPCSSQLVYRESA
jgi:chromate reductase